MIGQVRIEFSSGIVINFIGRESELKGVFTIRIHLAYFLTKVCFLCVWSRMAAKPTILRFCLIVKLFFVVASKKLSRKLVISGKNSFFCPSFFKNFVTSSMSLSVKWENVNALGNFWSLTLCALTINDLYLQISCAGGVEAVGFVSDFMAWALSDMIA